MTGESNKASEAEVPKSPSLEAPEDGQTDYKSYVMPAPSRAAPKREFDIGHSVKATINNKAVRCTVEAHNLVANQWKYDLKDKITLEIHRSIAENKVVDDS